MSNDNYKVKNPSIKLRDIPYAAVLVFKKYGPKAFLYKSVNFFFLKINPFSIQGNLLVKRELRVMDLYNEKFRNIQPIKYIKVERSGYRINIVTDSIRKESLFGGVATALILATLFANKYQIPLRIVTRETESSPDDFANFLKLMNIAIPENVEYYSDYDRNSAGRYSGIETSDKDIYLSTSWWTTKVVDGINFRKDFFYILQEVESFFYPSGDEQILCAATLLNKNVKYIINSKLLYDYYSQNNHDNVIRNGAYFEPAFPSSIYSPKKDEKVNMKNKYKLFFYARPNNSRNMFYTGIRILEDAISAGIIKEDEWDIYFAGSNIEPIKFSNGIKSISLGQMNWTQYAEFIKNIDLGLCLMSTPHPSYPPLDIAASGGVVLTNKFLNKQSLYYSDNIICSDIDTPSILDGFSKAVILAKDNQKRVDNFQKNKIEKDWGKSFEKILEFMYENK
jgi:hypothetical protein